MAYKTPGVYIKEISKFPPSVAEVETAIPAFIGYTEKAEDVEGNELDYIPTRIKSLIEFELLFGGAYSPSSYTVTLDTNNSVINTALKKFYLYNSMRSFFDNGGGDCYIVSVGNYQDIIQYDNGDSANPKGLKHGVDALVKYDEPTLILFPDAVGKNGDGTNALSIDQLGTLQSSTLAQCSLLQDRFGVFDVLDGFSEGDTPVSDFRDKIGTNNLKYGACYYPWVHTTYEHDFRLRNVFIEAGDTDTQILSHSLPADPDLDPLISSLTTKMGRTDTIMDELSGISLEDFGSLTTYVEGLIDDLRAMPSTDEAAVVTVFNSLLEVLRNTALAFEVLDGGSSLGNDIDNQIALFKSDAELHDQIVTLIRIEKNEDVITELSTITGGVDDTTLVDDVYNALDSTDWISASFTEVVAITEIATTELNFDTLTNDKERALVVLDYISANLDINKLISSYESLFDIALHNEELAEQILIDQHPFFKNVALAIQKEMSLLPPSGIIAGVYATVDGTRGVWKAPANISLNGVLMPAVKISASDQESLNIHTTGKSINVIRSFTGKGVLVWGARTLAGNDNEWRYVSVRRFFNMVEESVKKASETFVFESNDANTWVKIRSMISNYLTVLWRQGALAGASTEDAFFVNVGLGETMTAQDILEGRMNVEIGMAVVRPAEFIILKFSHKMQQS